MSTVAMFLKIGERPPAPASQNKRESKVNVRLNTTEKMTIEESARRAGFRSISDFIRTAALRSAS